MYNILKLGNPHVGDLVLLESFCCCHYCSCCRSCCVYTRKMSLQNVCTKRQWSTRIRQIEISYHAWVNFEYDEKQWSNKLDRILIFWRVSYPVPCRTIGCSKPVLWIEKEYTKFQSKLKPSNSVFLLIPLCCAMVFCYAWSMTVCNWYSLFLVVILQICLKMYPPFVTQPFTHKTLIIIAKCTFPRKVQHAKLCHMIPTFCHMKLVR